MDDLELSLKRLRQARVCLTRRRTAQPTAQADQRLVLLAALIHDLQLEFSVLDRNRKAAKSPETAQIQTIDTKEEHGHG